VLIAPAALLLGREGWRRARTPRERRLPAIGVALGVVSLAVFTSFFVFMMFTRNYPAGL
jgi:type VI protein secretion system component VasF